MLEGFTVQGREVERLLRDPSCGFVLVVGPDAEQARGAHSFWQRLEAERLQLAGVVLNRVHVWSEGAAPAPLEQAERRGAVEWIQKELAERGREPVSADLAEALIATAERQAALARRDAAVRSGLEGTLPLQWAEVPLIPLFAEDVHALDTLGWMGRRIFGEAGDD